MSQEPSDPNPAITSAFAAPPKTTDVACPACGDKCGVNKVRQPAYSNAIYLCLARHYRKDDHGQVVQCWASGHTVAAANARIAQARKP